VKCEIDGALNEQRRGFKEDRRENELEPSVHVAHAALFSGGQGRSLRRASWLLLR
jgi:hypothetical protein